MLVGWVDEMLVLALSHYTTEHRILVAVLMLAVVVGYDQLPFVMLPLLLVVLY